jgi:RNA polymerase sigma factor (TIGR02999 family)
MSTSSSRGLGLLLSDAANPEKFSELVRLTYGELRRIAGGYCKQERPDHTLPPTGLVHEAYLRLASSRPDRYENRAHYFGVMARTMRNILVDYARRRVTEKRGGRIEKVPLDGLTLVEPESRDFLAVHEALERLERRDPELAQVVEFLFFGGCTAAEAADMLGLGESTVRGRWSLARVWLRNELAKTRK